MARNSYQSVNLVRVHTSTLAALASYPSELLFHLDHRHLLTLASFLYDIFRKAVTLHEASFLIKFENNHCS